MTAEEWTKLITRQTKAVNTYQPAFKNVIDGLAKILAQRDAVYQQFLDEGAVSVIERVSDRGARNSAPNPLLVLWKDLNASALAYWRDLGLTPAGLKRINESAMQKKQTGSALEEALKTIGS